MEMIFISGCGRPKLTLPLELKGSGEQMSASHACSLAGAAAPRHVRLCDNAGTRLIHAPSCTGRADEDLGNEITARFSCLEQRWVTGAEFRGLEERMESPLPRHVQRENEEGKFFSNNHH